MTTTKSWSEPPTPPLVGRMEQEAGMDQATVVFDVQRMMSDDQPPVFLLEIGFRTVVIYRYTLLLC